MLTKIKSKALEAYRQAADLMKERSLELRAAEAAFERQELQFKRLLRELYPFVKLSKEQKAELKSAAKANDAAIEKVRAAGEAWTAAIDQMLTVGESR